MDTHRRWLERLLALLLSAAAGLANGSANAKSVYLIADINDTPTPIHAYDIQPAPPYVVLQKEHDVPAFGGGAVGIAIDGEAKKLLVTYESSNRIQVIDARGFADLGTTQAAGAANLAGIVVDHSAHKVYAIERDTNLLYVYAWAPATNSLTHTGPAIPLAGVARGYGLALDEARKRLYIGDIGLPQPPSSTAPARPVVRYFETDSWTLAGTILLEPGSQPPMAIAVDSSRNLLYLGNATSALGSQGQLVKYDLESATQSSYTLPQQPDNVLGVAVDEQTGNVYVTTGDQLGGGSDRVMVFSSALGLLASEAVITGPGNHGNPAGVAVASFDVAFNPLNFDKQARVDSIRVGSDLGYRLCYDNVDNDTAFSGVTITDALPAGTTFVSASASGHEAQGKVTWDIGTVAAGAQQACLDLVVKVGAAAGATIVNSATISGTIGGETIPTTQTASTTVLPLLNPLGLVVDDAHDSVESGAHLTYAVCYDNAANSAAVDDVSIAGALPAGTTFISLTGPGLFDGQQIRWDIGTVAADAAAVCNSLEVEVTATQGSITAAMQLSAADGVLATATDATLVAGALQPLNITLDDGTPTVDANGSLTFEVCYDNSGNEGAVANVVLSGPVPSGSAFVAAGDGGVLDGSTIVWNEGTVIPSPLPICHDFTVRVTAAAGAQVSATMQIGGDSVDSATATHSTTVVAVAPTPSPPDGQLHSSGGGGAMGFIELLVALALIALARVRSHLVLRMLPALLGALVLVPSAQAQEDQMSGWYMGAKFGQARADASAARLERALAQLGHDVQVTLDETATGWAVFGGYRFNTHLAVEAAYADLGEVTSVINSNVQTLAELQQLAADTARVHPYSFDGYSLAGVVSVPFHNLSLFAKGGWIRWRSDADTPMPGAGPHADFSEEGTDALFGAGLSYGWAKHWGLRVEWERYSAERNDVDLTSLSMTYRF